ncbi:hypothetical protein GGR57DRAFT_503422 [Xylariaceae sp. FL1272]|nr:hypothetical protein GGR57DRAFT_503422 [Xylariaceae sp. FL1272]
MSLRRRPLKTPSSYTRPLQLEHVEVQVPSTARGSESFVQYEDGKRILYTEINGKYRRVGEIFDTTLRNSTSKSGKHDSQATRRSETLTSKYEIRPSSDRRKTQSSQSHRAPETHTGSDRFSDSASGGSTPYFASEDDFETPKTTKYVGHSANSRLSRQTRASEIPENLGSSTFQEPTPDSGLDPEYDGPSALTPFSAKAHKPPGLEEKYQPIFQPVRNLISEMLATTWMSPQWEQMEWAKCGKYPQTPTGIRRPYYKLVPYAEGKKPKPSQHNACGLRLQGGPGDKWVPTIIVLVPRWCTRMPREDLDIVRSDILKELWQKTKETHFEEWAMSFSFRGGGTKRRGSRRRAEFFMPAPDYSDARGQQNDSTWRYSAYPHPYYLSPQYQAYQNQFPYYTEQRERRHG